MKRLHFHHSISRAALALAGCVVGSAAYAQTASQITPPTFRPDQLRAGGSVVFSGQPGLDAPAGAERLSIKLTGVKVEGALPGLEADQKALENRLLGGRIPVSEVFSAARDLEASYARAGYVLVRVVLPAQTLRDGNVLRIVVVKGFVEKVEYKDVPDQIKSRISAVIDPLVGRSDLRLAEIERKLLIAGDTPGVALRSTLTPGATPGGAILVVQARYQMVSGFAGFDNTLSGSLGRSNISLGLDTNSALGFGEIVYLRGSGHVGGSDVNGYGGLFDEYPRVRTLAAGAVVPLGVDGLTFNLEGTQSKTTPKPQGIQTFSEYERFSARLRYPWIRSRALTIGSELIFDATEDKQGLLAPGVNIPYALDRLRILRAATDAVWQIDAASTFTARGILSFGLDGLGARGASDATPLLPLTRLGADANFQKLELLANYSRLLMDHVAIGAYGRVQTSFNQALPQSEQIGIASFQELSTFDAGTLGGDEGWVIRGEVSSPWNIAAAPIPVTVAPYAFAATGALYLQRPTVLEQGTTRVSSLGLGVRFLGTLNPGFSQASLAFEFGRRFRDDYLPDANRFTVVGSVRF